MAARLLAVTLLALAFLALPARASDQHSTLTLLDGSTIAVDGPRDKPLYLKFWAT